MVQLPLLGAPLAVERMRREQLGLGRGALPGEAGLEVGEVGGQVDVGGQGGLEGGVGGGEGGVDGFGAVGEGVEEGGGGEDGGEVLLAGGRGLLEGEREREREQDDGAWVTTYDLSWRICGSQWSPGSSSLAACAASSPAPGNGGGA